MLMRPLQPPLPEPDPSALRALFGRLAASVAVVTAWGPDGPVGLTATSVTSVSFDPPSLLVCVNRSSRLFAALRPDAPFRVSYLSQDQHVLASAFGAPFAGDRFSVGDWEVSETDAPALRDALGAASCRLDRLVEHGTHAIAIGRIVAVETGDGAPLLWRDRNFARLA